MGWNTYNTYSCHPNETIVHSNAQALVSLGLADLGYRYVTTDCGWSVADRLPNGTLTWNETLFPSGFPSLGRYIHDLGLLFGVYGDSGIKLCGSPPDQAGSLYHENIDAKTFGEWEIDSLKYDNCYSDAATGYPDANYSPSVSPEPRYSIMSRYLQALNRPILFQICEWGIDFPALWAPAIGNSWRIGNDIIPHWRTVFRILNQAAPQVSFASPGQWPDLDMLEVGTGVFTIPEEQTHFSLWAILKSPLIIGADLTSVSNDSLAVMMEKDVISFNQDIIGTSASLQRRWSDDGYEVWSGPLSGNRTVAALINWKSEERRLTLDLPDIGLQYAGELRNIWDGSSMTVVRTSYTSKIAGHGTMLLELGNTSPVGIYPSELFSSSRGDTHTFAPIYARSSSARYNLAITFAHCLSTTTYIIVNSVPEAVPTPTCHVSVFVTLAAGSNNTITIHSIPSIKSIQVQEPNSTYYAGDIDFTLSGSARIVTCGEGFCQPVGAKIGYLSPNSTAAAHIPATLTGDGRKYVEIDYINNEIAFNSSWGWGSNSRNITIGVNDADPVRLEVPLSGRHSELYGPGRGWWDTATLGVLTSGWKEGINKVVIGNEGGEHGFQPYAADFVGLRVYD
ncbi:hypothetical protein DTO271D3_4621 [Paecilomyces variotii]|nr:hypothetical protein DTO169C6_7082 [Paecilomyces variotii]KAJ9315168.1 hypothetical protein DTO271D3_4621 [Paecilomyces variotii]